MEGEKIMKIKKYLVLFPLLLTVLLFSLGCGDTIKENITEKAIEKITDGQVDIDTKDGEVSVGTDDGGLKVGEDLEWPKESMGSLPEPDASIMSIADLQEDDSTTVILEFNEKDGGDDYMQKLQDQGYIQQSFTKSEMGTMYMAAKDDNTLVALSYDGVENTGSIMFNRDDDSAKDFFENKMNEEADEEPIEINMAESMDWPKDAMDNIPPIKAQITSVSQDSNRVSIGFKGLAEKDMASYIDEIKSLGFDLKVTEMIMDDFFNYSASNKDDHLIAIGWGSNEGTITYTKE